MERGRFGVVRVRCHGRVGPVNPCARDRFAVLVLRGSPSVTDPARPWHEATKMAPPVCGTGRGGAKSAIEVIQAVRAEFATVAVVNSAQWRR